MSPDYERRKIEVKEDGVRAHWRHYLSYDLTCFQHHHEPIFHQTSMVQRETVDETELSLEELPRISEIELPQPGPVPTKPAHAPVRLPASSPHARVTTSSAAAPSKSKDDPQKKFRFGFLKWFTAQQEETHNQSR